MMTRKDYEKAAAYVRDNYDTDDMDSRSCGCVDLGCHVRAAFEALFLNDNPRFDVERFRAACQPKEK